jgi:hypothetical protein
MELQEVAELTIEVAMRACLATMQDAGDLHLFYAEPEEQVPVRETLARILAEDGCPALPMQGILEYAASLGHMVGRDLAELVSTYDAERSLPATAPGQVDFNCIVCRVRCGIRVTGTHAGPVFANTSLQSLRRAEFWTEAFGAILRRCVDV